MGRIIEGFGIVNPAILKGFVEEFVNALIVEKHGMKILLSI